MFLNLAETFFHCFSPKTSSVLFLCIQKKKKKVYTPKDALFPIPIWLYLTNGLNLCALHGNLSLTLAGILPE